MHNDRQHFRLLVFVVAYNAQHHINDVLNSIPASVWDKSLCDSDILVIDDHSGDSTYQLCQSYRDTVRPQLCIQINAKNLGYGGNQKVGYQYAIDHHYDAVVLLHGDGQYKPALIPLLAEPVISGDADVVIGSRMVNRRDALAGGMPFYKFAGNIVLTAIQNFLLGVNLSEFHSGYRVYSVDALRRIPFQCNSDYFDFDTDILIQLLDNKFIIKEIAIPTFYGNEICHVNGLKYAIKILLSTLGSILQRKRLFYLKKFDYSG